MASLIEATKIKWKMIFELEGIPYHCLDVKVSKPTGARRPGAGPH